MPNIKKIPKLPISKAHREWNVEKLIRPKKEKRLPRYISPQQVGKLIEASPTEKHKLMFLLYYSTGIRCSEGCLLKWEDIIFEEGIIMVRKGKGAKDRVVILQDELAELLIAYRQELPTNQIYVFAGDNFELPVSRSSVQWAFRKARRKSKLPEWVSAHVLRHSYATTILRNGTDLLTLKELLGHKQLKTTSLYVHLNIAHFKRSHNPLSHQCLNAYLQQKGQSTP